MAADENDHSRKDGIVDYAKPSIQPDTLPKHFGLGIVLFVIGLFPLFAAIAITYSLLAGDMPTRDQKDEMPYMIVWWILTLVLCFVGYKLMIEKNPTDQNKG